jgi:CHAT domain
LRCPGCAFERLWVAEPSLELTLPKKPSELDDGLLTASEVTHLKLNAKGVVLSACYTAAADTPGDFCLDHPGARYEPKKEIRVFVRVP